MSLKAFEFVSTQEGYHYELSRGVITVSGVARVYHGLIIAAIRNQLAAYQLEHPVRIFVIMGGAECKLLIPQWESERHPDLAVYLTPPAGKKDDTLWRRWIPEFVIEVVTPRSTDRDYVDKREEYFTLGIKEYWIVDPELEHVVLLRRGKNDWVEKRVERNDVCTTKLLPGFKLPCKLVFDAAAQARDQDDE